MQPNTIKRSLVSRIQCLAAFWETSTLNNPGSSDTLMRSLNLLALNLRIYQGSLPRLSFRSNEVMSENQKKSL